VQSFLVSASSFGRPTACGLDFQHQ
jgi:hypothetical protein